MKKILLPLAAVALLASCSQNEVQEMTEMSNEKEIKFATLNDKVTRAANDATDPYQVYAKAFGLTVSGTANWFINDVLTPGTSGNATGNGFGNYTSGDQPTKKHYWPNVTNDWSVKFFAYAPKIESATNIVTTGIAYGSNTLLENIATDDAKVQLIYTVPTSDNGADAQEDFTIAAPVIVTKAQQINDKNVHFQFKHMLTKIAINCKLTDELTNAGYAIAYQADAKPSLGVFNVTGTIEATTAATVSPVPASVWIDLKDGAGQTVTESTVKTVYTGAEQYLILPQPTQGTTITLPIVITKDGLVVYTGNVTYTVKNTDIANNQFLPGKNYGMNITINNNSEDGNGGDIFGPEITFSSEVADWETVDAGVTQPSKPFQD